MTSVQRDIVLCGQCEYEISKNHMKCSVCNVCYHFSPCCSIQLSSYSGMSAERKAAWKCSKCRERKKSNVSYQTIISTENTSQKQKRNDEDDDDEDELFIESNKRFKDNESTNHAHLTTSEGNEMMQILMQKMTQITEKLTSIDANLQNQQTTLTQINDNVSNLASQVTELQQQNEEKAKKN